MALIEVKVPDIGDFDEVTVIEMLVKVGDTVKAEQSLITVESDKASMEIPCSTAGVVAQIVVKLGDKVKQGSVVVMLEAAGAAGVASAPEAAPVAAAVAASAPVLQKNTANVSLPPSSVATNSVVSRIDVKVPDIGDFKDVSVIEILVKVGDTIKAEQSLMTVESDKAAMEIPSSAAGVLKELKVKMGDTVNIGDLIAVLEGVVASAAVASAGAAAPAAVSASAPASAAQTASTGAAQSQAAASPSAAPAVAVPAHNPSAPAMGLPHASPSVRKFARELGVPLPEVKGQGPKGRITLDDVQNFTRCVMAGAVQTLAQTAQTAQQMAKAPAVPAATGTGLDLLAWPQVDFTKFGPVERQDMGRIQKISGANLLRNAIVIPAVTNFDDADITDLEAFRVATNQENDKSGIKIKVTMLAFLIKACVSALKKFPTFNASLDGDTVVYKHYFHIAFAADTPNGLVVPVIRDCDKKGVMQISQEMSELARKARDGKLSPADMQGACFTISSLGGIGGRYFTPIINAPEVAILGVCKSHMAPVWNGQAFQPRLMLPLSLTWDHRVIDGAAAARFNAYLGQILSDFRRVLL